MEKIRECFHTPIMPQKPRLIINSQNITISLQPVVFRKGKDSPFEHIVDSIRDMPLDGAEDMIADTISLLLSSPEKSLDAFVSSEQSRIIERGMDTHCPECGGRMVADGHGPKSYHRRFFFARNAERKGHFP